MVRIIEEKDFCYYPKNLRNLAVVLTEPYLLHPEDYVNVAASDAKCVFSHHRRFVDRYKNWYYYPLGGCHIPDEDRIIHKKSKCISMFISHKETMPGHILRRKVYDRLRDKIDIYGTGYNYVENKADGLRDYYFSIVIESCQEPGYFTEKIIDCFLTGTIPIYWGDPNIDDYFHDDGIINWTGDVDELEKKTRVIENACQEIYKRRLSLARKNFSEAREYTNYLEWIKRKYTGLLND